MSIIQTKDVKKWFGDKMYEKAIMSQIKNIHIKENMTKLKNVKNKIV